MSILVTFRLSRYNLLVKPLCRWGGGRGEQAKGNLLEIGLYHLSYHH